MNHPHEPPAQASPHAAPSTVEWIPLDGLAQAWAAFAQHVTTGQGFEVVSAAFAALEQETHARVFHRLALHHPAPFAQQDAFLIALRHLQEASDHWHTALTRLHDVDLWDDDDLDVSVLAALGAESYPHALHVAQLAVRLWHELCTCLGTPARLFVGTLPSEEGLS